MPRTHRYQKYSRSNHYKRDKERGFQRLEDRHIHHRHKNLNVGANEITYTRFNCKMKGTRNQRYSTPYRPYNYAEFYSYDDDYDWKKQTMIQYLERKIEQASAEDSRCSHWVIKGYSDTLKQLYRRGLNKIFVSHRKEFKNQRLEEF